MKPSPTEGGRVETFRKPILWQHCLAAGVSDRFRNVAVFSCSVMSDSLQPHGLQLARLLFPWDSPGKNTRVGCHALLQGIFPMQGLNPGLPRCRQILYQMSHQGSPGLGIRPYYSNGKESACNMGDPGSISGSGRSPEGEHGSPLQYSCLENPMDRGAW